MDTQRIIQRISQGRTDLVFDFLDQPDWRDAANRGPVRPLQWFVFYDDVTALKAVLRAGGDLSSLELSEELGNAAFFGHWKMCDFLIAQGADVNYANPDSAETALHSALAKAGRPYYAMVLRLLLEHGADPNARTIPGAETGAFMRDVRTKGETPLHRAAAYGTERMITLLLDHGADREARDANGDSPMTWASEHLRPGSILELLQFGKYRVSARTKEVVTSDHGAGWGNGVEATLLGEYILESRNE